MPQTILTEEKALRGYILVELQGTLHLASSSSLVDVGRLQMEDDTNTALFHIGHHVLTGRRVYLQHPISVLQKQSKGWCLVYNVTEKIVFDTRPTPVLS